jgi:predicted dehydrogenase
MSWTRRRFLEDSLLATAAALAANSVPFVLADESTPSKSPNEKLSVACVGVKGRGASHLAAYAGRTDTEVTYVCDADLDVANSRADGVAKKQGRRPQVVQDMRKIFDDKSVDIVCTATPNHWHALCSIWAMQAGKDVYVEKPVSHNVSEGRRTVEAARKYNRICQTGTQSRSNPGMRQAMEYVLSGKLGEVTLARGLCYKRRPSIGPLGKYDVPASVDYNLWCGPGPLKPLTRPNLHYDWHWDFDYGNGDLGNQGIHQMDICRWGLGVSDLGYGVLSYGGRFGYVDAGNTANTQVCIHDYGTKKLVFEVRGLETKDLLGARVGVIFYGSEGYLVSPTYNGGTVFDKDGKAVTTFNGGSDDNHFANFLKAVRSRKHEDLTADILDGHLSSALCHLGNVSYRLGTPLTSDQVQERLSGDAEWSATFGRFAEHLADNGVQLAMGQTKVQFGEALKIDPKAETIIGNDAANAMLTRQYRSPFVVPGPDEV